MTQPAARFDVTRPAPTSLVIDAALVAPGREEFNPRYGAPVWPLIAMSENPSDADVQLHWWGFPAALREQFRHAAWALVNFPVPDELLDTRRAMRARLSVLRIYHTGTYWRIFARWLTARAVTSLDQVTGDHLVDYSRYLVNERRVSRATVVNHLVGLSRLHTHGRHYLPADLQIGEPPWLREGLDAYLPAARASGENATEPISPSTMGPLLVWALRFVEDFADDILAAHRERQRLTRRAQQPGDSDSAARLRAYLENLKSTGEPVPACAYRGGSAGGAGYVAGLLGASLVQVSRVMAAPEWVRYREQNPGRCPLAVPVTGAVDGKPWTDGIDYYDAPKLLRHLVSACFIVLAFLMGARTGEILALEHGCCPDPGEPDSAGPRHHLVYGRQFKSARDDAGNHLSAGVQRETPWATVPQAATAIRVLEQITETGLLFSTAVHSGRREQRQNGRSLAINTMAGRMEDFIAWVNEHAADGEAIPADPAGKIATSRFRRTLAWHIARQPGGLVALAIQYGHLRSFVSEQYASRSRNGIHELLDFETARAVAEHLSDIAEHLGEGGGVSGPAARRLVQAAAEQQHRFGGIIATPRQARALLADPVLNVFENKEAYLTCNYDPSRALCHPGRGAKDSVPSLDRCRVTCANIARTDADAYGLVHEAARLDTEAASPLTPEPVADRLRERARHLQSLAAQHHGQRITLKETDAS